MQQRDEAPEDQVGEEIDRYDARQPLYPAFQQCAAGNQLPADQPFVHRELDDGAEHGRPEYGGAVARAGDGGGDEVARAQAGGGDHQAGPDVPEAEGGSVHRRSLFFAVRGNGCGGRVKVASGYVALRMTCR